MLRIVSFEATIVQVLVIDHMLHNRCGHAAFSKPNGNKMFKVRAIASQEASNSMSMSHDVGKENRTCQMKT